ncbi:hypothetical protein FIBSPDRAFT_746171, partial [Athelia psychrophila]
LEIRLLKPLTLLIALRLREWMQDRRGFRKNHHSFKLHSTCAIYKAGSFGRPLCIRFMDFTNAFPSTHRPVKLYTHGHSGRALSDW